MNQKINKLLSSVERSLDTREIAIDELITAVQILANKLGVKPYIPPEKPPQAVEQLKSSTEEPQTPCESQQIAETEVTTVESEITKKIPAFLNLGLPLYYEILRYGPARYICLYEAICKELANRTRKHIDYLATVMEEQDYSHWRGIEFSLMKNRMKENLVMYYFQPQTRRVVSYDVDLKLTSEVKFDMDDRFCDSASWWWVRRETAMLTGGVEANSREMSQLSQQINTVVWSVNRTEDLLQPRRVHASVMVDGVVYILGGVNKDLVLRVESFSNGKWQPAGSLSSEFADTTCASVGKTIYVAGRLTQAIDAYNAETQTAELLKVQFEIIFKHYSPWMISIKDNVYIFKGQLFCLNTKEFKIEQMEPIIHLSVKSQPPGVYRENKIWFMDSHILHMYDFETEEVEYITDLSLYKA